MTYSSWAWSFVSPENGAACVSPRLRGVQPAGRRRTIGQNLPACLATQVPGLGNCHHSLSPARLPKRGQIPRNPPESRCMQMGRWRWERGRQEMLMLPSLGKWMEAFQDVSALQHSGPLSAHVLCGRLLHTHCVEGRYVVTSDMGT